MCRSGLLVAVGAALLAGAAPARAQRPDFEVGPWLGWAAGTEKAGAVERGVFWMNAGVDATAVASIFGAGWLRGGAIEARLGPWLALHLPTDTQPSGEGGLSMILTQTEHASWGSFGLRVGGGHGGDRESYVTGTLWGGVRYVPARSQGGGSAGAGPIAKVTGIRIVMTYRAVVEPVATSAIVLGIEFEPEYVLPPYSPAKWAGAHRW